MLTVRERERLRRRFRWQPPTPAHSLREEAAHRERRQESLYGRSDTRRSLTIGNGASSSQTLEKSQYAIHHHVMVIDYRYKTPLVKSRTRVRDTASYHIAHLELGGTFIFQKSVLIVDGNDFARGKFHPTHIGTVSLVRNG